MYGSPLMRRLRNCYTGKHKYFTEDVWIPRCESLATKHDGNKCCTYLNRGAIQYLVNIFNTQWQYWCHINGYYYKILGIYHATPCMEIFRILVPQEILPRVNLLRNHALKAGICERVRVQAGAGARACVPSISCSVSCSHAIWMPAHLILVKMIKLSIIIQSPTNRLILGYMNLFARICTTILVSLSFSLLTCIDATYSVSLSSLEK